jgi:transcriptional regulator of acetoin/glycerol metabolism
MIRRIDDRERAQRRSQESLRMNDRLETLDDTRGERSPVKAIPGLVVVHSAGCPVMRAVPLENGRLRLGRGTDLGLPEADRRMSRDHAEIVLHGDTWTVRDLGSNNGTYVDGVRIAGEARHVQPRCVRIGQTLLLPRADIAPYTVVPTIADGVVIGPTLRVALQRVAEFARMGDSVLIRGESGAGKELAARTFHREGPHGAGPLVAVNCAAIPSGVAESLLFGARRGAYTGANGDVHGYVRDANHGVLFLDELGELGLDVQAKLLRVLETKEVLPLGTSQGVRIQVRFCFATHRDLHAAVASQAFRADLYYRIAQNEVVIPPLRDRVEEIPWLVAYATERSGADLVATADLVEACLVRAWPGNVRELLGEIRKAIVVAKSNGAKVVDREHLAPRAGLAIEAEPEPAPDAVRLSISREEIDDALRRSSTAAEAAKRLGVHRSQLYRLMKKTGIASARDARGRAS